MKRARVHDELALRVLRVATFNVRFGRKRQRGRAHTSQGESHARRDNRSPRRQPRARAAFARSRHRAAAGGAGCRRLRADNHHRKLVADVWPIAVD